MKKIFITLSIVFSFISGFCQAPNQSDGNTPPDFPPHDHQDTCNGVIYNPKKEKCTCLCGVIPIKDACSTSLTASLNCPSSLCLGAPTSIGSQVSPSGGTLSVTVSGSLQLLSGASDPNIMVKGTAAGSGTVSISYSKCGQTATAQCTMEVKDKVTLTGVDSITVCPNQVKINHVQGAPDGGLYSWTAGGGISLIGPTNQADVQYKATGPGQGSMTASYTVCNTTVFHTTMINAVNPTVTLNVPDTIAAGAGQKITITPTITPPGSQIFWSVSNGLTLNSGPYNFVAFITVGSSGQPIYRTATLKVTICGQTITKTVVIKVNPCLVTVSVPDSIFVLVNGTASITASGNMNGSYAWSVGGPVSIQGPSNDATVTVKGTAKGTGSATVTFSGKGCKDTKTVKIIVIQKPTLTIAPKPLTLCKGETRLINATYQPPGGTFSWSVSSNSLDIVGNTGSTPNCVIKAKKGGMCTVTCTYTVDGQSVTDQFTCKVLAYSKIEITASNNAKEVEPGTTVTYTAKAYDDNGQLTETPVLHWRVVYIPVGQEKNVGNWVSYDLQGGGDSQTYTWGFPQGNYPLKGKPPYKMKAWIEAAEYCTYRIGSYHLEIVKNDTCKDKPSVGINCGNQSFRVGKTNSVFCGVSPAGGQLTVSAGGSLQLLSGASDPNIQVKGISVGNGTINVSYTLCGKTVTDKCNVKVKEKVTVTGPDTLVVCPNIQKAAFAEGKPNGGTYSWTASPGINIEGPANQDNVAFKSTAVGNGQLRVTYTVDGDDATHTVNIRTVTPSVKVNTPDTILAAIDQTITISPVITPATGSSAQWAVSNGLKLLSGPYNYVAFIKVEQNGPEFRTATLTAKVCGQVFTKTVVIKVNPCVVNLSVPDSIYVLTNGTASITATGNTNGTYAWSVTGQAGAQGATNQQTVTVKGNAAGTGWAEVTFTANNCNAKKKVKIIVVDKPTITLDIAYAPMDKMCKGERRIVTAIVQPSGGSYNWSLGSNSHGWYGPAGNIPNVVIEALKGGNGSVSCTYTVNGQSASASLSGKVYAYSKIEVTASNNAGELAQGTTVTYTAKAYDDDGNLTATPTLRWKVVYIPVGQEDKVQNWRTYDLQGTGESQTYTWSFPQGNFPLKGNPPYKMKAWIEAVEYCTYRSGSVHIEVVSQTGR